MTNIYTLLVLLYATLPPLSLFYTLKLIYHDNNKYGWHLHYLFKYLATLSFLPILFLKDVNLGLIPKSNYSLFFLVLTFVLVFLGLKRAIRRNVLFFYNAGVFAGFMEEFLYRGVIFGLVDALTKNVWVALGVSSFFFGVWHLKNYYWSGKHIWIQFLYTFLFYGPLFSLMRIYTGDLYLAILFHYITDATVALAPDWMRGWLVQGGKTKEYKDNYL